MSQDKGVQHIHHDQVLHIQTYPELAKTSTLTYEVYYSFGQRDCISQHYLENKNVSMNRSRYHLV
jgi:hypothetical protein